MVRVGSKRPEVLAVTAENGDHRTRIELALSTVQRMPPLLGELH